MVDYKTVEKLQCELSATDTVLIYGDYVFVTYQTLSGFMLEIYTFLEKVGDIESKLEFMLSPNQKFNDGGHAIEWALQFINNLDE